MATVATTTHGTLLAFRAVTMCHPYSQSSPFQGGRLSSTSATLSLSFILSCVTSTVYILHPRNQLSSVAMELRAGFRPSDHRSLSRILFLHCVSLRLWNSGHANFVSPFLPLYPFLVVVPSPNYITPNLRLLWLGRVPSIRFRWRHAHPYNNPVI
jgi:hypothetical protein